MKTQTFSIFILLGIGLSGCSGDFNNEGFEPYITEQKERIRQKSGTIHGNPKGFVLYSDREDQTTDQSSTNGSGQAAASRVSTVNPYLWQASLESLDFMPLAQADSNGGVIITDWYAPSETPEERFKITVYVLDPELRADALRVNVFRQVDSAKGWVDAPVDGETAKGLEDNILTRARELRLTTVGSS